MTLTSKPLAALVLFILLGGIFFSSLMGWFQTESTKIAATFTEGEFAGQANPADIRGSYTLGDVEKNFGVPAAVVAQAFGVSDPNPAAYAVKNLETLYENSPVEIGTDSVRMFVAFYTGLPMDLTAGTFLPDSALPLLSDRNLSSERLAYLETHTVALEGAPAASESPAPETVSTEAETDRALKGKTTFGEVLSWGVSPVTVEQILGQPLPAPSVTVKDFCVEKGLSFETIKPLLQAEIDKAAP